MRAILWKLLRPLVEGAITLRLLQFHQAMVARGQIPDAPERDPRED